MSKINRRSFLKSSATATAAAIALPTIIPQRAFGANERLNMGLIGCGGRGHWLSQHFTNLEEATVIAVCDVDTNRRKKSVAHINNIHENKDCKSYSDFRELLQNKDIDAVIVATPDHWHGIIGIAAANAGKHIYCEKPLCNSIGESKAFRDAVVKSGIKLQTGSHERSRDKARYCVELIRNGYIGNLKEMQINLPTTQGHHDNIRKRRGNTPKELPIPNGLNWDMWLGHTPKIPYYEGLDSFGWRFNLSFGCGEMSDRGAHVIDLAQFGNNTDNSGPIEADARGWDDKNGVYNAPMQFGFTNKYANGVKMYGGTTANPRGVKFIGDEGWLFLRIHEGTLEASNEKLLKMNEKEFKIKVGRSWAHSQNFIDGIKGKAELFAPVEVGHRSCCACLINMMSMRLQRRLEWDPIKEQFINDDEANKLMTPVMRAPWSLG
jgi:predicted dehydrogenase